MSRKQLYNLIVIAVLVCSSVPTFMVNHPTVKATYGPGTGIWIVATNGSDSTGTGTLETPFATFWKASNNTVAGDIVYIRGGTFTSEQIIQDNGTTGNLVTYQNYNGEAVYINSSTSPSSYLHAAIIIRYSSYIRITGINVINSSRVGIHIYYQANHITMDNLSIGNCSQRGIVAFTESGSGTIENITIENCSLDKINTNWNAIGYAGEGISIGAINFTIQYCNLYDMRMGGIDIKSGGKNGVIRYNDINSTKIVDSGINFFCIYFDEASHIECYNNNLYGAGSGINFGPENSTVINNNISCYNNIINVTNYYGFLFGYDGLNDNISLYMNTVYIHAGNGIRANGREKEWFRNIKIYNNIFVLMNTPDTVYSFTKLNSSFDGVLVFNNNLEYRIGDTCVNVFLDGNNIWTNFTTDLIDTNPEFVNINIYDFHLNYSSPCIDAGNSTLVSSFDFDGNTRPQHSLYDIGAFEFLESGFPVFTFSNENPSNNSLSVVSPTCNVTINELHGYQFNVTIYELQGASWVEQSYSTNGVNGSFSFVFTNASDYSRTYSWMVCAMNRSVWHNETYTFTTYGNPGTNLRSDGSHLFMTMEDGIRPYYSFKNLDTEINIDSNNSIEGKYSLNISKTGTIETEMDECIPFNYPIKPTEYTVKFIPKIVPNNGYIRVALGFNPAINDERMQLKFDNTTGTIGEITITDLLSHQHFTDMEPWQQNCIYTVTLSNIVYRTHSVTQSHLFDATLSNATASQTLTGLQMGTSAPIYGDNKPLTHLVVFAANPDLLGKATVFIDDWTVGTQSNISTSALWPWSYPVLSSSINETQAQITGTIVNDGSPLQNNSEFNNTVSVLYDTVPHNTTSYSYYFNDYNTSIKWIADPQKIIDNDESTIGGTGYPATNNWIQQLTNHTGNITNIPTGNISKIEIRAKTWITEDDYNGKIYLQPISNGTNGTRYNTFSRYTNPTEFLWSDWIDITSDVNYSHPDWNDIKKLRCNLIAEFPGISGEGAWCSMVQLHILVNLTLDYAYNTTLIDSPTIYTGVTTSQPILGLTPGQVYFYRNKINTSYTNSSSYFYGDEQYFLTKPYAPTSTGATPINETCINISWTKGTGANTTVVVYKTTGYPSSPYDGKVVYNDTGTYFLLNVTKGTPSYTRAWSYDAWSVNPILWHFSDNYTEFNWSIVGFNVFNESRLPYLEAIGFDLEITNREGTFVYYATNCNNTHFVNITNIPTGTNIHIIIRNNTNYRFRDYYMDVFPATIYNESFYLPTLTTETPGPEDDCSLRTSIDSISISSNATDATITLQHDLEEIISVELYNDSLYGTYGGWLFIASSNYTTATNTVIVNKSVLDINTTMIRVQYYYMYCVGTVIDTPLYYLRVVETIETEYTEVDRGVPDAIVNIKRYVNDSGTYETVAGPITDANGYVNVYLIPNALYKVFINKTGYEEMIADYIPAPPNEWGQTTEKIFRIISLSTGIENVTIPPGFYDHIIFNGTMFTNGSIYVNYVDLSSETINAQFYTYSMYNYSRTLINTQNTVLLNNFQYWITGINASRQHMVTIFLNHTTLGTVSTSIFLGPVNNTLYHDPAVVEDAMEDVYGHFDLGFVRFFIEWLPFIGILIVLGRIEAGMGIFGGALYLCLVGKFFGDLPAELWQVIPIILLFAVLWYIATKGKFRL